MSSLWPSLLSGADYVGWGVVKLYRILSCHSPRHLSRYFTVRELVNSSILRLQPSRQSRLLITLARFESLKFIGEPLVLISLQAINIVFGHLTMST